MGQPKTAHIRADRIGILIGMSARAPGDLDKQLSAYLKAEMARRDLSYAQLGKLLNLSKSTCQRLVACESSATLQVLSQIRRALKARISEIFPGK